MAIKAPNSANPSAIYQPLWIVKVEDRQDPAPPRRIERQSRLVKDGDERNDETDGDSFEQGADCHAAQQDRPLHAFPWRKNVPELLDQLHVFIIARERAELQRTGPSTHRPTAGAHRQARSLITIIGAQGVGFGITVAPLELFIRKLPLMLKP